jgi:uncharacterized protein YcnI
VRHRLSVVVIAVAAFCALAAAADAHVSVTPDTAAKGSFTKLSFRVPNERDVATTKVELALPDDHPIAVVSVRPVPGWTVDVQKTKLAKPLTSDDGDVTEAVSRVVWSGGSIDPGQFQEFDVSVGPLPADADRLVFKALQTYADGQVVRWIDEPVAGGAEPEHPAAVVDLAAAADNTTPSSTGGDGTATPTTATSARATRATPDRATTAVAGAALAAAVVALAVAALAIRRTRSAGTR